MPALGPMIAWENSATVRPRSGRDGSDIRHSLSRRQLRAEHEELAAGGARVLAPIGDPAAKAAAVIPVDALDRDCFVLWREGAPHDQPDLELVAAHLRDLMLRDRRDVGE